MRSVLSCFLCSALALPVIAGAQNDRPKGVAVDLVAGAVAQVRGDYFKMDYITGVADADKLLKRFPQSRALAAWRAANLARISQPRETKAAADALLAANKKDPWGWFAQTVFLEYAAEDPTPGEALKASEQAYQLAPGDPDMQWVRAMALSGNGEADRAVGLIDSVARHGPLPQQLRTLQATVTYSAASKTPKLDRARADSAFAIYAHVRATDSLDVTARSFAASRLLGTGRNAEAYDLAKDAVRLSPLALATHQTFWQALGAMRDRSATSRDSEIVADVDHLVAARGTDPSVLSAAAGQYASHGQPARARETEERLLSVAPTSLPAEWVYVNRYRAAQKALYDSTSRDTAAYTRALWAFIDRPTHQSDRLLGDAYRSLYSITDSTTNADTLLRIVQGMVKYEGINPHVAYAGGAIRLAQRGRDFKIAEQLTRDGLKAGKAKIDGERRSFETIGEYAAAADWMSAFMYDALGVVYMHEGRLDSAQKVLEHARDLDPKSVSSMAHLGDLAEKRGRLDDAERLYMKGSLLATPGTNPNRAALQRVYVARHGSLDGYETYLAGVAETDRANRRAEIAKTRIAKPAPMPSFNLKTLDGKLVTLDSLRGHAVVINTWGMWCGWCVAELPEVQALSVKYAGDSAVRILTIDNDPNSDSLRTWMAKKRFTFTTLLDDGFLASTDAHLFPTTWFLDGDGRVVFQKIGWSEKAGEEFGWRIEMIKHPSSIP
jgi:tetratricopeptide (TPR) repeat protein/peroxiredoxin